MKTINATKSSLLAGIARAVYNNDLKATQALIGQGAPVDRGYWIQVTINKSTMYHPSLLAMAIQHNNKEMVALLLTAGANLDSGYRTQKEKDDGQLIRDIDQLVHKNMWELVNPGNWHTFLTNDSRRQLELRKTNLQLRTEHQHLNTLENLIQTIPINNDFKVRLQQKITNRNIYSLTIDDMNRFITEAHETADQYKDKRQCSILISFVIGLLATYIVGIGIIAANAPLVWALLPAITAAIIGCSIAAYCNAQEKEQLSAADSAYNIGLFLQQKSPAASPSGNHTPQAEEGQTDGQTKAPPALDATC